MCFSGSSGGLCACPDRQCEMDGAEGRDRKAQSAGPSLTHLSDVASPVRRHSQAHHNARTQSDEYVVRLLVSHEKVATLVHELLVIEVRVRSLKRSS